MHRDIFATGLHLIPQTAPAGDLVQVAETHPTLIMSRNQNPSQ